MDKIPSFEKDHDLLQPGLHFSTLQKGVMTLDMRCKRPNAGDLISPAALHSIEHMLATALRSGPQKEHILYFGPMGCRTGFYLLTEGLTFRAAADELLPGAGMTASVDETGLLRVGNLPEGTTRVTLYDAEGRAVAAAGCAGRTEADFRLTAHGVYVVQADGGARVKIVW